MQALPRLYAIQLDTLRKCPRRFHKQLADRDAGQFFGGFSGHKRRYALHDAVREALGAAHAQAQTGVDLHDALTCSAPTDLEPEQAVFFERALAAYGEAVEGRDGTWRERPEPIVTAKSATGRFEVSAFADVILDLPDGGLEVRNVSFARRPVGAPEGRAATKGIALALRATPHLRLLHLWVADDVQLDECTITAEDLAAFGRPIALEVLEALDAIDAPAVPGWYCAECPFLYQCPGVPQLSTDRVLG